MLNPKMLWYCHQDPERQPSASAEIHELELNSCVRPKALHASMLLNFLEVCNDVGDICARYPVI